MIIEEEQIVNVNYRRKEKKIKMQSRLWNMILLVSLPLMIVILILASVGIVYAFRYNAILNNVTMASDFNQNFKDDVDLKMYYYVIDSQYSIGLPLEEVQSVAYLVCAIILKRRCNKLLQQKNMTHVSTSWKKTSIY